MKTIKFDCSLINILILSRISYQLHLAGKVESVTKRMRRKVYFFVRNTYHTNERMNKEIYVFKSKQNPGIVAL